MIQNKIYKTQISLAPKQDNKQNTFSVKESLIELRIGVVGYSPPSKFDIQEANKMIKEAFNAVNILYPNRSKAVVSGLTYSGIPALAYQEAVQRKWRTVGIACSKASNYKCFPVDEKIIVGNEWGDESPTFLNSIDVLIRIGGGKQSLREAAETKARGKQAIEYDLVAQK